uniref:NADH-ubiquinone oxidoreductase chain 2 n=1 Tax=Halicryptus spinulosus TaxID=160677 RepID=L0N850_9BILA|nr:NADH dehydrogenase subunit 2 [Halicryptus spinulosus]CBK55566.1 NADH dehydrogenase subunit 2 [Halicryptus spinulosus]
MLFLPYYFIFWFLLGLSTILVFGSSVWFTMWLGLEINMLSFVVLLISGESMRESEAGIKYFLVQVLGSILFLFGSLLMSFWGQASSYLFGMFYFFIVVAVALKLGMGPVHFWFPGVMDGIRWMNCGLLMTWQKLGPFCILAGLNLGFMSILMFFFSALSGLIGGFGGLNQVSLRKLLAFSSIGHLGWLTGSLLVSDLIWRVYFLMYSFLSFFFSYIINSLWLIWFGPGFNYGWKNNFKGLVVMFMFFSLGGLPPFGGFFMKWMVFSSLLINGMWLLAFILIGGSLMNLYYYLRVTYGLGMLSSETGYWGYLTEEGNSNVLVMLGILLGMFGMFFSSLLMF